MIVVLCFMKKFDEELLLSVVVLTDLEANAYLMFKMVLSSSICVLMI